MHPQPFHFLNQLPTQRPSLPVDVDQLRVKVARQYQELMLAYHYLQQQQQQLLSQELAFLRAPTRKDPVIRRPEQQQQQLRTILVEQDCKWLPLFCSDRALAAPFVPVPAPSSKMRQEKLNEAALKRATHDFTCGCPLCLVESHTFFDAQPEWIFGSDDRKVPAAAEAAAVVSVAAEEKKTQLRADAKEFVPTSSIADVKTPVISPPASPRLPVLQEVEHEDSGVDQKTSLSAAAVEQYVMYVLVDVTDRVHCDNGSPFDQALKWCEQAFKSMRDTDKLRILAFCAGAGLFEICQTRSKSEIGSGLKLRSASITRLNGLRESILQRKKEHTQKQVPAYGILQATSLSVAKMYADGMPLTTQRDIVVFSDCSSAKMDLENDRLNASVTHIAKPKVAFLQITFVSVGGERRAARRIKTLLQASSHCKYVEISHCKDEEKQTEAFGIIAQSIESHSATRKAKLGDLFPQVLDRRTSETPTRTAFSVPIVSSAHDEKRQMSSSMTSRDRLHRQERCDVSCV